jgi:hypothetical protein
VKIEAKISTNTYAKIFLFGIIIFWPDFFTIFWQKFSRQFLEKLKLMQKCSWTHEMNTWKFSFLRKLLWKQKFLRKRKFCENYLIFAWFSLFAKIKKNPFRFNPILCSLIKTTMILNWKLVCLILRKPDHLTLQFFLYVFLV